MFTPKQKEQDVPSISGMVFDGLAYTIPFDTACTPRFINQSTEPAHIPVFDALGRLVQEQDTSASIEAVIGSGLPAAVYTLVVTQQANTKTLRIIKR